MKEWSRLSVIVALGVALLGCVSIGRVPMEVQVSGYAKADYPPATQKYLILPAEKGISPDHLEFSEYARYVDYALSKAGFQKASSPDDATVVVFLSYGIGNPEEHQYSITLPVYGQTGVSSSTTTGTVNTNGNGGTDTPQPQFVGPAPGTTTYTPSYGITGYQNVSGTYVTYFRYIALSAVDLVQYRENQRIVEVWKTDMASVGSIGDLRRAFPVMIAASEQYIGRNTGTAVKASIIEADPEVANVRSASQNITGIGGGGSSTAYVRFQNTILSGGQLWSIGYGVRAGTAEYDGALSYGSATPYYLISPGTYALQMKTATGSWQTVTTSVTVTATSGNWTVVMAGDWSATTTYSIVEDSSR